MNTFLFRLIAQLSRYSSNLNVYCLRHSSKLCNRVFRYINHFFRRGNIPIAK